MKNKCVVEKMKNSPLWKVVFQQGDIVEEVKAERRYRTVPDMAYAVKNWCEHGLVNGQDNVGDDGGPIEGLIEY